MVHLLVLHRKGPVCGSCSQSSFPSFSQFPAWAEMGRSSYSAMVQPSQTTLPSGGWGFPRASCPSGPTSPTPNCLPDPRRRREDGEPRPPRAPPPLSTESSEEEGSEPDSEGFRLLRLEGRRDSGGSSSSSDSEPWADEQIHVSAEVLWPPEALRSGNWGQRGGSRAKRIFKSPSKGGDVGQKQEKWFLGPQTMQPHPSLLPANSLRASGNACDGASCPFCHVFGLWCGGAGIQSGRAEGGVRKAPGLAPGRTLHPKTWFCLLP